MSHNGRRNFAERISSPSSCLNKAYPIPPNDGSWSALASRLPRTLCCHSRILAMSRRPPAVTDDPMPEVAEAGHDRTVINLKSEWLDTWLNPDPEHMDELQMAMDDPQRPYY